MDIAILNGLIAFFTAITIAVVGFFIQRYLLKKNQENTKYSKKQEVYNRLNKKLSDLIDVYSGNGFVSIVHSSEKGIFQAGIFPEKDIKKEEIKVGSSINFKIVIPPHLCAETISLIDEAILIAKDDTKNMLSLLRKLLENFLSEPSIDGVPLYLYKNLEKFQAKSLDACSWDIPSIKDEDVEKFIFALFEKNLEVGKICNMVKIFLSKELI